MIKVGQVYRYTYNGGGGGSYSIEKIVKIEDGIVTYRVLERPSCPSDVGNEFPTSIEEFNDWIQNGKSKLDKEWRFKQLIEEMQKHISKH